MVIARTALGWEKIGSNRRQAGVHVGLEALLEKPQCRIRI